MIYSDFAAPTVSTSADTAGTTATVKYNGAAKKALGIWGAGGAQTLTAAQAIKLYALFTGDAVPSPVPNIPFGYWVSGGLAPQGAQIGDPTFQAIEWDAPSLGVVTIDVRNAASATAPLPQVGIIYSDGETLPKDWGVRGDIWNLREIPKLLVMAGPTSITTTTETAIGSDITVPPNYTRCVGVTGLGTKNGVVVAGEEFFGTIRYTNTGASVRQFDPAQKWPFFGQMQAGLSAIIDGSPNFAMPQMWHPLLFDNAKNAVISGKITLVTAITNASAFQFFGAFR